MVQCEFPPHQEAAHELGLKGLACRAVVCMPANTKQMTFFILSTGSGAPGKRQKKGR